MISLRNVSWLLGLCMILNLTPLLAEEVSPSAQGAAVSEEKAAKIQKAAETLIKDEIEALGSFGVDHPDTGDLLELSLVDVEPAVRQAEQGAFVIRANCKDQSGTPYPVDVYLSKISPTEEDFEIIDAIVAQSGSELGATLASKPKSEEELG